MFEENTKFGLLPEPVVDELVAVSTFASLALFRLDALPGTQLIVDPLLLWPTLLLLLLLFFDFQSFIFMALNKVAYSLEIQIAPIVARIFACFVDVYRKLIYCNGIIIHHTHARVFFNSLDHLFCAHCVATPKCHIYSK